MTTFNKSLGETLTLASQLRKTAGKAIANTVTLGSGVARQAGYNRSFTESLTVTGLGHLGRGRIVALSDALSLTDLLVGRLWIGKILGENLTLSSALKTATAYKRRMGELTILVDLPLTRVVGWNRLLREQLANPDAVTIVRDAWNIIKHTVVPEIYTLPNYARVFEFLELFGHEYNRALGFADSLPRLTGIRTAPAHLVPKLIRLIAQSIDPNMTLAEQYRELENSIDVYKRLGRADIAERRVDISNPAAAASIDFPDDEVLRWSESPVGGWSNTAVWGDQLEFNHHVARLSINVSVEGIEQLVADFIPAGVKLIVNIGSTIVTEIEVGFDYLIPESEFEGDLLDEPDPIVVIALYMGDSYWFMGDDDKYIADEENVNGQPCDEDLID